MVYVLNTEEKPLIPCKEAKARKLLKQNKAKVISKEKLLEYNKPIWIECIGDKCDLNISFEDWGFIEGLNCFDKNRIDLYWIGNDVPDHPFLKDYGETWIAYTDRPE